ncbi:hypothetical protein D6D17_00826 [Aureobasidium pullulans]|uniref:C2H2-type domain-containing protein n=1 Tax=Aureobasidium pullulans TaxID=5580 RepID=A0A4S8XCF0_AURPU|nr:hypothetical protein D6D27_00476 [Aureobasidium pullulans]THW18686.1 hypothetical protein D6D24_03251 [Aureobasidium pullulans]THW35227.1 hypothetical protein D6D25_05214 [Aureobasidium pullulans]THW40562.1 hypothetical protein D6D22_05792 [Aureobasidium pullulans]THW52965.1 hypothetical protein D6D21_00594 [Aureobasidium pullulans]
MSDMLPESPLSSLSSSDEADDHISTPNRSARPSIDTDTAGPPSKKRRTGGGPAHIGTPHGGTIMATGGDAMEESEADISCDSEGSAPGSPSADEFAMRADQVTTCAWEGCSVGDLANSDELIAHVQNDHIAPKRARYTCEWGDCARKGTNHPSGYALKAHMRSHTKEKPFFCHLPECDRSFTRSDALAKHMRTVHEPEPPRAAITNANPIDPATGQPKKGPKLRLSMNGKPTVKPVAPDVPVPVSTQAPNDPSPPMDNIQYIPARHPITGQAGFMITYPPDIHFSQFESEIPANQLMRLLRRQLHWAQSEGDALKREVEALEDLRCKEWAAKEALLEGVLQGELAHTQLGEETLREMKDEVWGPESKELEWSGTPWWTREDHDKIDHLASPGDMSVDDVLEDANHTANAQQASASQAERDEDMMAVGALMGLSGAG